MNSETLAGIQFYRDDLRYCDQTRSGLPHPRHRYHYDFIDEHIERCAGSYWCDGLTTAESGRPWPERPPTRSALSELFELIGDRPIMFWMCAKDGRGSSLGGPPRETVRWIDGVARCMTPGCGRTSLDPQPECDDSATNQARP